jgi:hypothetical protein
MRTARVRSRRGRAPAAVQEALFEVVVRPEVRFYRQILDALSRSDFGADPLASELVLSRLFGTVWAGQDTPRDGSTEEAFGVGLVAYLRQRRTPTAMAVLRTVAVIAPIREVREAAEQAVFDPAEPVGAGRCWAFEDIFGDEATVVCEFVRGGDRHAVLVFVDHAMHGAATDAMLTPEVDALIRDMSNETRHTSNTLRLVDPAWARAMLGRAFARTDLIEGIRTEPGLADVRALALARLRLLPDDPTVLPNDPPPPGPDQQAELVARFLREAPVPGEPSAVAAVTARVVEHVAGLRVSPGLWETFAADSLPAELRPVLPAVARGWSAWAGRLLGLPESAMEELAASVDELFGG